MGTDLKISKLNLKLVLSGLAMGIAIGVGVGYFVFAAEINPPIDSISANKYNEDPITMNQFRFLNPSIAYLDYSSIDLSSIEGMDSLLLHQIETAQKSGKVSSAAIYYRDLTTNQKVGVNESEVFSPGSLMKVPIMIAIYKYAEAKPHILEQKLLYTDSKEAEYLEMDKKSPKSNSKLIHGSEYTVSQLIDIMIIESDNEATIMLIDYIEEESPQFLRSVESELGMIIPDGIDFNENFITIRTYASFFRVLYNSSYLEKKYSELALETLSKTGYGFGIRQSIPQEIPVAHKYGVKPSKDNYIQLHHFGIVYHQKKPFLIGIMTKGKNIEHLKSFIAEVTSTTFQRVDERAKKVSQNDFKKDIED